MARNQENTAGYEFETVLLQSERTSQDIEMKSSVTDFEVFEHLERPYLTAQLMVVDSVDLYSNVDILGGERITVRIKRTANPDAVAFSKTFYVDKTIRSTKSGDHTFVIHFHLVEDCVFVSNLKNVNRFYEGSPSKIVKKIAEEFLGKEVKTTGTDKQNFKAIVPNLSPIQSMLWIARRSSSKEGYPIYMHSSLTKNTLFFNDLGSMLRQPVINSDVPYKYSTSAVRSGDENVKRRAIGNYEFAPNSDNLYKLITKGLVGASYNYVDTLEDKQKSFTFDVVKDLFKPLIDDNVLQKNQINMPFSEEYKVDGKSFNKLSSATISQLRSTGAYREVEDDQYDVSYSESKLTSEYRLEIISRAMDNVIKQGSLTMTVNGEDFIDGDKHSTIGNNLRCEFLRSIPETDRDADKLDPKKSGDYLIYAAKHMFKREKYDLILNCVKIGNYRRR